MENSDKVRQKEKVIHDTGVERKSDRLAGRRVAFGVCGGIGAVETVKQIRELRRHGADVSAFLTPSATRFISELSLSWAADRPVVSEVGPDVDHLDSFDVVVVAPLTLNTLARLALGLTDNPVALLVAGQFGRKGPVALVPAMNAQLFAHPLYSHYRERLEAWGARFFTSPEEEGRIKMPAPESLANWIGDILGN